MRYLNSHYPTVAKNHSFLHFKTSIRSMKGSHSWSRIAGSIWYVWNLLELYITKKIQCPNGSIDEWFEGKYGLVNSTKNTLFQSIMSYVKLVITLSGYTMSFGFPLTLKLTKYFSDPKTAECNIEEMEPVNLEREVLKIKSKYKKLQIQLNLLKLQIKESKNTINRDSDNGDGGTGFMAPKSPDEDGQTTKNF